MRRRKLALGATAAVVAAVAALALYWVWAAGQVRAAIALWTEQQRAAGYAIAYQGPVIGGFPVRLSVAFAEPRVAEPEGWRWSAAAIAGTASLWQPLLLHLDLPKHQELRGVWRGFERTVRLDAASATGTIRLDTRGRAVTASVEMTAATLIEDGPDGTPEWTLSAGHLRHEATQQPPPAPGGEPRLLLRGEVRELTLPQAAPAPFPKVVGRLAYDASVVGAVPAGEPAAALAAWRDAGGVLEIADLTLLWGALEAHANGTATLDQALRPEGAFSARIGGLPEVIDALVALGAMAPTAAAALRVAVLTFAEGRDAGGRPVVRLPVTLQDGQVFLGPLPVARLDPVL
jgi:hypothetical protein